MNRLHAVDDEISERHPNDWIAVDSLPPPAPPPPTAWARARSTAIAIIRKADIDLRDALLVIGILMIQRGCYLIAPAAGWLVPGLIVFWYAVPSRPVAPEPETPVSRQPRRQPDGRS